MSVLIEGEVSILGPDDDRVQGSVQTPSSAVKGLLVHAVNELL